MATNEQNLQKIEKIPNTSTASDAGPLKQTQSDNKYSQFIPYTSLNQTMRTSEDSKNSFLSGESHRYTSANEYAEAVRCWLAQYQSWYQTQIFHLTMPYYMMGYMSAQQTHSHQNIRSNISHPVNNPQEAGRTRSQDAQAQQPPGQRIFRIAPVWKRVFAELFDFLLLFMMKLAVTIVAVEHMGIMSEASMYTFIKDNTIDYNATTQEIFEALMWAFLYRCYVCIVETFCLRKGVAGMVGGTTPGKRFMGIRVVSCEDVVVEFGNGYVRVTPAGDIGFWNALVRSVIKNFSLAFFFPVCFTALFFQHHRAAYDVISNCIVVEPVQPQRRR